MMNLQLNLQFEGARIAKPFLKWAGGKTQLIDDIKKRIPSTLSADFSYVEPFVGSGAVLFWMLHQFPKMKTIVINDINQDLINVYSIIATHPKELIDILQVMQSEYHSLEEKQEEKRSYYNQHREKFNTRSSSAVQQAALLIFLNKTCFNGLYRVNRKNEYNVPIGSYYKPTICDAENILAVSEALQKVEILCGDFQQTIAYAKENTLFYFDPPYKPLNQTSSFNTYAKEGFDDNEQVRLRDFCMQLDALNCSWILSNSDLQSQNDPFFDKLYADFNINRVNAKRSINSKAEKRGVLTELLITNY